MNTGHNTWGKEPDRSSVAGLLEACCRGTAMASSSASERPSGLSLSLTPRAWPTSGGSPSAGGMTRGPSRRTSTGNGITLMRKESQLNTECFINEMLLNKSHDLFVVNLMNQQDIHIYNAI